MSNAQTDPSHIMQVGSGFWASKTLLSAVELRVFTLLGEGSLTGEEIRTQASLSQRGTYDFLDTLVALRLLDRDGEGTEGRYRNTPDTAAFLDERSPTYIGGILEMFNARLYGFWGGLTEALQTGLPQNEVKHTGRPMFDELYADPARLAQFMHAMEGISLGNFHALARGFDFSRYTTVCDVGGATGQLSTILARRHSHLRCTTFDLPVVTHCREDHRGRRPRRPCHQRIGRFPRRRTTASRRHHDGHDPARLEPRPEAGTDRVGVRRPP